MSKTIDKRAASAQASISRRDLMKSASATAATAALMSAVKAAFPAGAFAQAAGPEVKGTKLGYIALTDASPLIIAKEKGFFAKHGLPDMEVAEAGLVGRHARQHGARHQGQRHRRRAHLLRPKVHLYTTGKVIAEQSAAADVHAAATSTTTARASRSPTNTRTSRSAPTARRSRRPSRRRRPPARR